MNDAVAFLPQGLVLAGVDIALVILLVEALALGLYRWRAGRGLPFLTIALVALSGIGLLLALKAALAGWGLHVVALGLALGGLAHGLDLARRISGR